MEKNKRNTAFEMAAMCLLSVSIPALLAFDALQAHRYESLSQEVSGLEKEQERLVEQNKKLVGDISVLSSSARIEKIARDELGMRKAQSGDIVRVEMKSAKQ